jgi:hypothetical protein
VKIHCTALPAGGGAPISWDYTTDEKDAKYRIGDTARNSRLKWEGNALLVNTLVSGHDRSYTVMGWTPPLRQNRVATLAVE